MATVVADKLQATVRLPGELQPHQVVAVYAKAGGFVEWIGVDRGSRVRSGQVMVRLVAPEITAQRAEAEAKLQSAGSHRAEVEATLAQSEATFNMLREAAKTPGVVAGNDLVAAEKTVEASRARVKALLQSEAAAHQALRLVLKVKRPCPLGDPKPSRKALSFVRQSDSPIRPDHYKDRTTIGRISGLCGRRQNGRSQTRPAVPVPLTQPLTQRTGSPGHSAQ